MRLRRFRFGKPMVRHLLAIALTAASLASCTDWNTGDVERPVLLPAAPGAPADVAAVSKTDAGIKTWETWPPPTADALAGPDVVEGGADSVFTPGDGTATVDDASVSDATAQPDGSASSGADAVTVDVGLAPWDASGGDAWAGGETWVGFDSWTAGDAGGVGDAWVATDGATVSDGWVYPDDAWTAADGFASDVWQPDGIAVDDAWVYPDAWLSDLVPVDAPDASVGPDAGVSIDVNSPDWQGYEDLVVPPGVDINAGALASCSEMYLYQKDKCGPNALPDCVASMQNAGSVYANYRFAPLAECEKAVCSPMCATVSNDKCLENCIGKYCANQFFSCIANGASGTASCADTFACSNAPDIKGKMWSIAVSCLATASPTAQQQFAGLIGCVTQPQTQTCIPLLAACYGDGSGQASCAETLSCSGACNGVDTCSNACIGQASPSAVTVLDALWSCVQTVCVPQCNGDKACQDQCLAAQCKQQLGACIAN